MKKGIELFKWIRKIEFSFLEKYYKEEYKDKKEELNLLEKYLIFKNFEPLEENKFKLLTKFIEEEKYDIKNSEKNNQNEEQRRLKKIYDILFSIASELTSFTQGKYNKFRKHKLLYFMLAFAINKNPDYGVWEDAEDIINNLFYAKNNKREKIEWCAFDNGPILKNIYKSGENVFDDIDDKLMLIDDSEILKVLEISYIILKNFTTMDLIEESHNTDPWKNNYEKNVNFKKIENNDIIDYFSKNEPFFIKLMNK